VVRNAEEMFGLLDAGAYRGRGTWWCITQERISCDHGGSSPLVPDFLGPNPLINFEFDIQDAL
jgi:hypothetical protein